MDWPRGQAPSGETAAERKTGGGGVGKLGWGESSAEVLSPLGVPIWELPVGAGIHQLNRQAPSGA